MLTDAVVLAGSSKNRLLQQDGQVGNEALIPIGNKMMVEYVVEALKVPENWENRYCGPVRELSNFIGMNPDFIGRSGPQPGGQLDQRFGAAQTRRAAGLGEATADILFDY